jgi:hypothetical protein
MPRALIAGKAGSTDKTRMGNPLCSWRGHVADLLCHKLSDELLDRAENSWNNGGQICRDDQRGFYPA